MASSGARDACLGRRQRLRAIADSRAAAANCLAVTRMSLLAILLVFATSSLARAQAPGTPASGVPMADTLQRPAHKERDSLLGLDKPKHFLLSAFIESVSFSSLQATGSGYRTNITAAAVVTGAFAVGKEFHDRKAKGVFSFGDLAWDAAGAAMAGVMLRHTYR